MMNEADVLTYEMSQRNVKLPKQPTMQSYRSCTKELKIST